MTAAWMITAAWVMIYTLAAAVSLLQLALILYLSTRRGGTQ